MEQPSTARIALKWGVIFAIIIIIYSIVLHMTGLWKNPLLTFISFIILLPGVILAVREYKLLNEGYLNFGDGLGTGALMAAVAGLIAAVFGYIYVTLIDTTISGQMLEMQRERLEAQGLSPERVEEFLQSYSSFMTPGMMLMITWFIYIFFGFIWSLIVSVIQKNSRSEMMF
ncbi:DUF4199 domain-containing protein [Emticicia sp. 17c]|uniref:DUF4199 domain-containing protein n=1 Tax=Emticicia sp. 17c TaxID=3127704 RepID=UPI00301BA43D